MERIVYRKTLDVHKNGIQFTLQGFETADKMSRKIEISLMASGDTIDLPLEQMVAMMYVTTPNATEPSINECTIEDNTIVYDVLPIVESGITEMQLKLIDTRPDGANGVLATPKFAIEVSESSTDDESAEQSTTYTALEDAIAKAKGVYDARFVRMEIDGDCIFRVYFADGTMYETDVLKETLLKGEALLSQSYARGGTGIRIGEDTDNSLYYSNVSKSASADVNRISGEATELLNEVTKHGVYTSFSVDFNTGEVKYISPSYSFSINVETGELEANGEAYTPEENIEYLVNEWLETKNAEINNEMTSVKEDISGLTTDIGNETTQRENADEIEKTERQAEISVERARIDNLESANETINASIEDIDDSIAIIQGDLETANGNITANSNDIETIGNRVTALETHQSGEINIYENTSMGMSDIGTLNYYITGDVVHIYGELTLYPISSEVQENRKLYLDTMLPSPNAGGLYFIQTQVRKTQYEGQSEPSEFWDFLNVYFAVGSWMTFAINGGDGIVDTKIMFNMMYTKASDNE